MLLHVLLVHTRGPQTAISAHPHLTVFDLLQVCGLNLLLRSRLVRVLALQRRCLLHFVVVLIE